MTATATPLTASPVANRTAVVAAGLIAGIACAAYVLTVIFIADPGPVASSRLPMHLAGNAIATCAFIALTLTLPALAVNTRLPRWALLTSAVGCALCAAMTWAMGTYVPHALGFVTDAQARLISDQENSIYGELFGAPKTLACMVGFIGVGVIGFLRRAASRWACALLVLAGVVSFLAPPWPGGALAGFALAWIARTARPTANSA